jgi:hypothetical protein
VSEDDLAPKPPVAPVGHALVYRVAPC